MSDVTIKFKNGTVREFKHRGRAGGSWTVRIQYEGAFVVVIDEWENRTAFPAQDISEVSERPTSYGGW